MSAPDVTGGILIAIPVLLLGGTELHTLALARALQSTGAKTRVCCYYEYSQEVVSLFEDAGVDVMLLHLERSAGLWRLFRTLIEVFSRFRPRIVHVQYIAPGLVPVAAAKVAGIRTVFATVHQLGDGFGPRERLFFAIAARCCTAFFCVSQAVESSWFGSAAIFSAEYAALGRRHFTIYNGVDVGVSAEAPSGDAAAEFKRGLGLAGRRVIGIVARLRAEKGHGLLLDALRIVLQAVPDVRLLVVGAGPDREALTARARVLGVESHIIWTGERSPQEARALYGIMDVVAVPSRFEGFGLSAAEAMAAGRPVVATRVGGLSEIVEDGVTGYLIPPDDSSAFAAALVRILGDLQGAANMGQRGRKRASEQFSSEHFAESFAAAYGWFTQEEAPFDGATRRPPHAQ